VRINNANKDDVRLDAAAAQRLPRLDDEDCVRILKNCRRATLPGSKLVIVDSFLGPVGQDVSHEDIADVQGAIIDLHMLVEVGGRERSVSEYEALLQQADLSLLASRLLPSGYVLMEAAARPDGLSNLIHQTSGAASHSAESLRPFA
jgi:hypothetical protein